MDVNLDVHGWLTADEIAALRLPEVPKSGKRVHDYAERYSWEKQVVDSAGRIGRRREYRLPEHLALLAQQRLQGNISPAYPSARQSQQQVQYEQGSLAPQDLKAMEPAPRFYGTADVGPAEGQAEINAHLLWLCYSSCLQVYGEGFARESVQVQIDYAVDFYNLLLRLSAARRADAGFSAAQFNRLEAQDMASQLRLLVRLKWVKPYPPPPKTPAPAIF